MYEVMDGDRTLKFNGVLLGESSSWRPGASRWIEFELYRTEGGSYVLSRVGVSLVFHVSSCPLVKKYKPEESTTALLADDAVPCDQCRPTTQAPIVFPERDRYWAQVSDSAETVVNALYKKDENNARYLTKVAQRLLDSASELDDEISSVYLVELIP